MTRPTASLFFDPMCKGQMIINDVGNTHFRTLLSNYFRGDLKNWTSDRDTAVGTFRAIAWPRSIADSFANLKAKLIQKRIDNLIQYLYRSGGWKLIGSVNLNSLSYHYVSKTMFFQQVEEREVSNRHKII